MKNRFTSVNPRRLIFVIILLLLISAGSMYFLRDIIREVFVLPLSYIFFVLGIFLRSTSQTYFWIVLLILIAVIAYRSLKHRTPRNVEQPIYEQAEITSGPSRRGRVYYWMSRYSVLRQNNNGFYTTNFHQSLGRLLIELLAYRFHLPPLQVEQRLRSNALDVPVEVREYLLSSLRPMGADRRGFLIDLWDEVVRAWRNFREGLLPRESAGGEQDDRVDPKVIRVIKYIEEELEVPHDDTGR